LDGPADLSVEIISPESVRRDRKVKFKEYESAGVGEYWLIDPDHKKAEFYQLDASGRYQLAKLKAGVYHSKAVAGFWLRVDWLWQPPTVLDALRELKVM
ncbi:MAG: Uma2 family endonuclease, partial [Blastocatellia bacterium]